MIKTIILYGIIAVIVFTVQFVFCMKANKNFIKFLPLYIIIAVYAAAAVLYLIDVFNGSGGVAIWTIFAFIISIPNTVALAADILAWVVYKQIQKGKI